MRKIAITMDDDGAMDIVCDNHLRVIEILWMLESSLASFKYTYMSRNPNYTLPRETKENYDNNK